MILWETELFALLVYGERNSSIPSYLGLGQCGSRLSWVFQTCPSPATFSSSPWWILGHFQTRWDIWSLRKVPALPWDHYQAWHTGQTSRWRYPGGIPIGYRASTFFFFFANYAFFRRSSVHEPCPRGHFVVRGEVARISTSKENNVIILPGGRSVVVGMWWWSGQQSTAILFKERVRSAHIQDNLKPPRLQIEMSHRRRFRLPASWTPQSGGLPGTSDFENTGFGVTCFSKLCACRKSFVFSTFKRSQATCSTLLPLFVLQTFCSKAETSILGVFQLIQY